jgi:hypothetical protein
MPASLFLVIPQPAGSAFIHRLMRELLDADAIETIAGKLAIVEAGRIRIRG